VRKDSKHQGRSRERRGRERGRGGRERGEEGREGEEGWREERKGERERRAATALTKGELFAAMCMGLKAGKLFTLTILPLPVLLSVERDHRI
jgi:hypothetical protein